MLRAAVVVLLLLAPACFSPSGAGGTTTDDGPSTTTTSTTSTATSTSTTTDPQPTTSPSPTASPTATATSDPTASTTSSSTGVTTETDGLCGNGMVEGDEQCDDGNDIVTDECAECRFAECGDGFVEAKVEECDGTPGCDSGCRREFLWVFVTNEPIDAGFGGLDAADKICQDRADNAARPGQYKAWLSIDLQSASQRFVHSTRPWFRTDMELVAANWDDLIDGMLVNPIAYNEFAEALVPPGGTCGPCPVWTNSGVEGEPQGGDCGMWTGLMTQAGGGDCGALNESWTVGCGLSCQQQARLYCLEQPLEP